MEQPYKPPSSLPSTKFEPKLVEVRAPSGRKYVLRELSIFEQMQADSVSTTTAESIYYRMALAIESIDGEVLLPRQNKGSVDALMRFLPGPDGDALVIEYAKAFSPQSQAETVKNESTPSD